MYPKCLILKCLTSNHNYKPCRIRQSGPFPLRAHANTKNIHLINEYYRDQLALSSGCPLWSATDTTFEATTSVNESTRRTLPFQLNYPSSIHRDLKNKLLTTWRTSDTPSIENINLLYKITKRILIKQAKQKLKVK